MKGAHPNHKLQKEFDEYGMSAFSIRILELVGGKVNLIKREQEYLNKLNFDENYNIYNSSIEFMKKDVKGFTDYIDNNWINKKIYKKEDKQEILGKALEFNIISIYKPKITFIKVIKHMINELGYSIESKTSRIQQRRTTYKRILNTLN